MAHLQLHLNTLRALHIFAPFASNSIQSCQAARNLSFSICHLIFLFCFVGWALQRHQLGLVFRVQCRTNLGFTKHCLVVFGSTNLKARLSTLIAFSSSWETFIVLGDGEDHCFSILPSFFSSSSSYFFFSFSWFGKRHFLQLSTTLLQALKFDCDPFEHFHVFSLLFLMVVKLM